MSLTIDRPADPPAFARFEWMLAMRYLRARRRETFISVISGFALVGIMLGVATLIIVMSVMNGFRSEILSKVLGVTGHVLITPMISPLTDYRDVLKRIRSVPDVTAAVPFVDGQVLVSSPSGARGVLVRSLREEDLPHLSRVAWTVREGEFAGFDGRGGAAIGSRLAATLGLSVGDPLTVLSPRGPVTAFGTAPRVKAFPVAAVFEVGMAQYDSDIVFLPLAEAQAFFNQEDQVGAIEVYIKQPDDVRRVRTEIAAAIGRPASLTDWTQRNANYFTMLQVERNVMFIILTLLILVAALNIVSGLTMLVKDKSRDIAILRTIGASRGSVLRVFFITGASISVVGTIAGVILALVFCANIDAIKNFFAWLTQTELFSAEFYFLSYLPAEVDAREVAAVVALSLGLSFLATLYPAWRAARLDPVEALRYE